MNHPIEVPPELSARWISESQEHYAADELDPDVESVLQAKFVAQKAAEWAAGQELEACCESIRQIWELPHVATVGDMLRELRLYRRPRPLSLKKQALIALDDSGSQLDAAHYNILRRAIEALPN